MIWSAGQDQFWFTTLDWYACYIFLGINHQKDSPPIYLYLIFLNLYLMKLIFELDFLSIWNLIFASYTGSKNQVWNRQKIKFKIQVQKSILWTRYFKNQVHINKLDGHQSLNQPGLGSEVITIHKSSCFSEWKSNQNSNHKQIIKEFDHCSHPYSNQKI